MEKATTVQFILIIVSFTHFICHSQSANETTSLFVTFDPYVSILDKYDRNRYTVNDLLPLVAKVASKFDHLFIELTWEDLQNVTSSSKETVSSLCLSVLAIAEYNAGLKNQVSKLELWLAYKDTETYSDYSDIETDYDKFKIPLYSIANQLQHLANRANTISSGTVTTILLLQTQHQSKVHFVNGLNNLLRTYKWGIILNSSICAYTPENKMEHNLEFNPRVIIESLTMTAGNASNVFPSSLGIGEQSLECHQNLIKSNISTGSIFRISDTYGYNRVNMSGLVSSWNQLIKWSQATAVTVILSKAFDTPYERSVHKKTCGWWRLVENASYNSTSNFVFEEKAKCANQFDKEENFINLNWLDEETNFSRDNVGIIYSLYDPRQTAFSVYREEEMSPILDLISKKFSKVLILIADDDLVRLQTMLYEVKTASAVKDKTEIMIMIMPYVRFNQFYSAALKTTANEYGFDVNMFSTFIASYVGNNTIAMIDFGKNNILVDLDPSTYKMGVSFNISVCHTYAKSNIEERQLIDNVMERSDAQVILFYFEEDGETVRLGAKRMFKQRVVLLEQCRNFMNRKDVLNSKTINFIMLHYATDSNFHQDLWAMQNFVRYWEMLSDWANMTKTTVIMNSAVDGKRTFKKRDLPVSEVGWWRFQDFNKDNLPGQRKRVWIDKKKEALNLAKQHFKKQNNSDNDANTDLTTGQILLIVLLPVFISLSIVTVGLYVIKRRNQDGYLSNSEINDFFHGNYPAEENEDGTGNAHKLPYDKSKYEIDSNCFSIDEGKSLGSGEYGRVIAGKIQDAEGKSINVAIKTVNPVKFRKTTLSGLLSEIKVLAHVGQHCNIIQLLGANTSDLKHGKVFIFLELCQLGSLQNYLQKLQPDLEGNEEEQRLDCVFDMNYINMTDVEIRKLDPSLSEDLYRWSRQICNGMTHLATKHVVHADLAARNILLNLNKEAKICDFGLSRRMYNYASYVKQQQEPLPWKWMAPESLRMNMFNEKSDVWAYGVTLWEIYSLGDTPYPGLSWDAKFAQMLQLGFRLSEPQFNERDIYSLMKQCWELKPENRPSFADLQLAFK